MVFYLVGFMVPFSHGVQPCSGAVICFYLAKFLGRPVVEKIVSKKALRMVG